MSFFSGLASFFVGIGHQIWDFLIPMAKQIQTAGGPVLLEAALEAVTVAEAGGGTGPEKFAAALGALKQALIAKGLPIVENAAQGAILAAVAQIQSKGTPK